MYKVVIIDDEPIIVRGLSKMVPWEKYRCEVAGTAFDGQEGLELIRRVRPDIVISDIYMPKMDGLLMAAALKSEFEDMELTILTGYRDFELLQQALRLGATRYVLKPSNMEEIEEAVQTMTARLKKKGIYPDDEAETGSGASDGRIAGETGSRASDGRIAGETGSGASDSRIAGETGSGISDGKITAGGKTAGSDAAAYPGAEGADRPAEGAAVRSASDNFIVRNALEFIRANYVRKITLKEVADNTYVSQWHLSKLLNRHMGQSFSEILNSVRIEEAKKLLQDPSLRIGDVAEAVGFLDMAHFSRVFKKITGVSANEYRNRL